MFTQIFLKWNLITTLIVVLSVLIFYIINPLPNLESNKCPFCYGQSLCSKFQSGEIYMHSNNLSEKLLNLISVKNIMYAKYLNEDVVLKKLAHSTELRQFDEKICKQQFSESEECNFSEITLNDVDSQIENIITFNSTNNHYTGILCPSVNVNNFLETVNDKFDDKLNIWTILNINAEPIILQVFRREDGWPVPRYFGACGRFVSEEYCGNGLNSYANENWLCRARIALQLMNAAAMFTNAHSTYHLYLTDISPDNIVIDALNQVRFIDLENVIIKEKVEDNTQEYKEHISENYEDCEGCFTFSTNEICRHSVSDHNYFSMCKLLLSPNAAWPMMTGGLLHSAPGYIKEEYPKLFGLINNCVNPTANQNRIRVGNELINELEKIVSDENNF